MVAMLGLDISFSIISKSQYKLNDMLAYLVRPHLSSGSPPVARRPAPLRAIYLKFSITGNWYLSPNNACTPSASVRGAVNNPLNQRTTCPTPFPHPTPAVETRGNAAPAFVAKFRIRLVAVADSPDTLPIKPCATHQRFFSSTRRPGVVPVCNKTNDPGEVGFPLCRSAQPKPPAAALDVVASELVSVGRLFGPAASRSPCPYFFAGPSLPSPTPHPPFSSPPPPASSLLRFPNPLPSFGERPPFEFL